MTRGIRDTPLPHDPLRVGQPIPGLKDGWSDPQGVEYYLSTMNPQSFGADAPPTGGYNKSDLLAEVLSHPIYPIRHPR